MISRRSPFVAALLVAIGLALVALGPASARAPHLNVKLGLWEATTVTQTSGPPPIDMTNMTPEQRARVEAMMSNMQKHAAEPHTIKSCLTEEKLEKSLFDDKQNKSCKQTVVTSSATDYAVRFECKDESGATTNGEWHFVAVNPEAVTGTADMTMERAGRKMQMTSKITAKYIGAQCGEVK